MCRRQQSPSLLISGGLYKNCFVVYKEVPMATGSDTSAAADGIDAVRSAEAIANEIADRLDDASAEGIANTIGALIGGESLPAGARLPTVRALASRLGVSANTVSDAWRILQHHGAITTERRRGTRVRARRSGIGGRYWQVPVAPGTIDLDLSTGTPDSDLLPPLGPVMHRLHTDVSVTSYVDPPLLQALEDELRQRWPYEPEALTVVDGAQDALDRVVSEVVQLGDVVVVENPTFPPLIDMLEMAGARVVGVGLDSEGPKLAQLSEAMALNPVALLIQPRAHNPTGVHISEARTSAMAELVSATRTLVIEDDHSAGATGVPIHSLGVHVPDQVVHIHSFSKSHGPDLRIAALGGPRRVIEPVVRRRQLGPSWTSRLIQQILLTMLHDPETDALVANAAAIYSARRAELTTHLARHGTAATPGVGLNVWVPVADEQRAVVALAAYGIGVAPGGPFHVATPSEPHIRVSIGMLRHDIGRVAEMIAMAARDPQNHGDW
jgi:DNA-binding transcriptional MocR family regulator